MAARTARNLISVTRTLASSRAATIRPAVPAIAGAASSSARILATPRPLQTIVQARTFSGSAARFGGGETDAALSAKLAEELSYEQDSESAMAGQNPEWLDEFHETGVWKIVDKEGMDEVVLERAFGNENLRLTFSISDLDNPPDTSDLAESSSSDAAEESPASNETDSFPIRCSLSITKPSAGSGALVMDLLVEDESFVVDSASFYPKREVAEEMTAEGDWKRRGTYVGPRFDHLDLTVQTEFENFLEERDINQTLAIFIPLYCEFKEQKEYVSWLANVKKFIDL